MLNKDRHHCFRGQTLSRPRTGMPKTKDTGASVVKKKKVFKNFFQATSKKKEKERSSKTYFNRFPIEENKKDLSKFFPRFLAFSSKISTVIKIMLSFSRGEGNFEELRLQGQRLQTVSLRMSSTPRTSLRTPSLVCILCSLVK